MAMNNLVVSRRYLVFIVFYLLTISSLRAAGEVRTVHLSEYLEQVKAHNPEARVAVQGLAAAEAARNEATRPFVPELYAEYHLFDNRQPPTSALYPAITKGNNWKAGVRKQTTFGLNADAYVNEQRTQLDGLNPAVMATPLFAPRTDYAQSAFGVNLKQSLWRDGLGEGSRAKRDAELAATRIEVLKQKFALKNILLKAENAYWSLVSYNEIIKLQTENVERARKLRDHMRQRASLRLYDDVDAMQAEANFEQRELDVLTSRNEHQSLVRQFNTLRGTDGEAVENLDDLPKDEFMLKTVRNPSKRMSREDFQILLEQAKAAAGKAKASGSQILPQLDIVGGISSNGLDTGTDASLRQAGQGKNPNWNVGVVFSMPLDFRLIADLKSAYRSQEQAALDLDQQAKFSETRVWDDLIQQNREAQSIYDKALILEKLQTDLVKKERQRMMNGRSTMGQTTTIEQNLASVQIARVKAQLGLLQIHNVIKQFEELP